MRLSDRVLDRLSARNWTQEEIDSILGSVKSTALTHATNPAFRVGAASGGTVTALLDFALANGFADAALVARSRVEHGVVRAEFCLARSRSELLEAQGSKYVSVNFVRDALPMLRAAKGRIAVVALPCDISTLRRRQQHEIESLGGKVAFTVALFCSHNSRPGLVDMATSRIEAKSGARVRDFSFRTGHWRGNISYTLTDGRGGTLPTGYINDYRNLGFFSERKCLSCSDHFGYEADISAGDTWLYRHRARDIKPTVVLVRTEAGQALFEAARVSETIYAETIEPRVALDGQSRSAPHHHNVSARKAAGRALGVAIHTDTVNRPVGFGAWFDAFLTVGAARATESAHGSRLVARIPHLVIRVMLIVRKALGLFAR